MEHRNYQVTGMTCAHCESSVREEVETLGDVEGIEVSAKTGKLTITAPSSLDDAAIVGAVREAGYQAERI